jgi:transposase
MMGRKDRADAPMLAMTLEDIVPTDHFYRYLDRVLDLSFVRELVQGRYAAGVGRPSVDPVVFFRLQLVMFFEGIRSERQLLRMAADRLSVRWYLAYNLDEPLPDHSSLTRIRLRYGLEVFRRFFPGDCRAVPAGGAGMGPRALLRRHPGAGRCRARVRSPHALRSRHALRCKPTCPVSFPRRRLPRFP